MLPSKRQRVKDDSDSSDSDGSEYGVESNKGDDHNNVAPGTHMLGLSQDYVPSWTEGDAFREWYQNWKDSIIQTFNLNPRPFILEKNTTDSDIQITIHRTIQTGADQSQKELLGYIKFIKQTGTLELANFNAALDQRHLSLGGTTKRDDSKSAGTHGEGFKVAALVMTRNNRVVHIESSSAYWKFGFRGANKEKFSCQITKPAPSTIKKHHDSLSSETSNGRARRNLTSYVHRDVIVRISTPKGYESIKEQQFWDWSLVAIDLHCPSPEKILRTEHGDLLIGPPFAGRIYLKGLRVPGQGLSSATYSYGYDFANGRINRDRERMMNQMEEAKIVASIWEMAVIERPELTKDYVRLFDVVRSPDVAFADTVVSKKMAEHLWQYLLKDAPDCFFYADDPDSQSDVAHQAHLINNDLKKKARILPRELWKMLRKFKLARTPEEHIDHKFLSSEAITIPDDLFAMSVSRMLRAAMQLEHRLKICHIVYVKSDHTSIDVRHDVSRSRLFIHEKWLHFDTAHQDAPCDISDMSQARRKETAVFACDHVVEDLFDIVLGTIMGATNHDALRIAKLRSTARRLFRQTPRDIKLSAGSLAGQLRVKWTCNDPCIVAKHHGDDINFYVRLHRDASCWSQQHTLVLHSWANAYSVRFPCLCPTLKVPLSACSATFGDLDPQSKYFPMVARYHVGAFFGVAPPSVAPQDQPEHDGETRHSLEVDGNADAEPVESTSGCEKWIEDQQAWRKWHAEDLPIKISQMVATRNACKCDVTDNLVETSFESRRLNFKFEKDQYVRIRDTSGNFGTYIALVHDVSPGSELCVNAPHLIITKYSFYDQTSLLWDSKTAWDDYDKNENRELLLHCTATKTMGTFSDNEIIAINDIDLVGHMGPDFDITYCAKRPENLHKDKFFCRFSRSVRGDFLTLAPISPHLLARQDRRKKAGFPDASPGWVVDLTPEVLGPMEGFCSAGYQPFAAFGFDEDRDVTWKKIRHHTCRVFDGDFAHVLDDVKTGRLHGPVWPSGSLPTTVLAAGINANFALTAGNQMMPSVDDIFHPLEMAEHALDTSSPDFTVVHLPPAMLHNLAADRLGKSIVHFLESDNAVQINASSVGKFGILQSRRLLTIVASSYHGLASVPTNQEHQTRLPVRGRKGPVIADVIDDLSFFNQRSGTGYVCSVPPDRKRPAGAQCYNHNTGYDISEDMAQVVNLMSIEINFETFGSQSLVHPIRNDSLTIREFARIQGFPDDFVFYGSDENQYDRVTFAQPPPVARAAAERIKAVIKRSPEVKLVDFTATERQNKRRREDVEE
ncbi:putative modification methylase [Colletotrichum siamense]|uniref:Modification methylase n=1 Tax=Colletotrichum siamense TaxID=690259 RepID=A0A9P5BQ70_COLSI|nr:putative modification methylase [Colletotrichum siamense]KAF4848349.1 putative modification methylase [Colletotrichum siamense]